jgi:predicted metal-dependent hydrolase
VKPIFGENSTLPYLDKNYPLKILRREGRSTISFVDEQFVVNVPSRNVTARHLELLYEHWLIKTARLVFRSKVELYSRKLGVKKPEKIIVEKLKNRWSSVGKNGASILPIIIIRSRENPYH